MAKIDAFFKLMHEQGASDLHMVAGSQPILRIRGEMERVKYDVLDNDTLKAMLYEITTEEKIKEFEERGDVDFGHEVPGLARYRVNFFNQKWGLGAVFREIPSEINTIDELGLPKICKDFAMLNKGLVLVTGTTGSGKSTTLAAMINHANKIRKDHIITIEDPIEFVHQNIGCIINHREIGVHTKSFAAALRSALREDPDIILVGEMRDLETTQLALEAASTGHLVFATLHTQSAAKTIDRIIDQFPAFQQNQVRMSLSESLKGVIAQALFKSTNKKGRCAAIEVLIITYAAANLIREGKTHQLVSTMQTGKKLGMKTLDDAIIELLGKGWISTRDAFDKCIDKERFLPIVKERGYVPPQF